MRSAVDLFATYAGRGSDLAEWLRGAVINRDRNLRMLYLAGVALNLDDSAAIYADMLAYRRFPADIFISAEGRVDLLREAMDGGDRSNTDFEIPKFQISSILQVLRSRDGA
jgi:spermidine synthase